ncbi:MAG: hypothetical protein FWD80_05890 [Propionibacteriaceae bacterium]|nr:hypothetical protein [Propionibacteriaceae bacterium]
MSAVLDAGALIAIERRDLSFGAVMLVAQRRGIDLVTSSAVVAQVWRGGNGKGQVNLARQLRGIAQRDLTAVQAREIGMLLGVSGTSDVVDGHIALSTRAGDTVHTSDVDDIRQLLACRHVQAAVELV